MELDPQFLTLALEPSICELVANGYYNDAIHMLKSVTFEYTPILIKNHAICYMKLEKYMSALQVIKIAEEKGWCLPDIMVLKGQCLYNLMEWETALSAFECAEELKSTPEIHLWITRCKTQMMVENDECEDHIFTYEPLIITDVKKEWYQTNQHVCVRLLVKDVKKGELEITFNNESIDVKINQKKPIVFHMNLFREIIPEESTFVINNSSVELKLKKSHNIQWETCEYNISLDDISIK